LKKYSLVIPVAIGSLVFAGAAFSTAEAQRSARLQSKLDVAQQIPPPTVKSPGASGQFTGMLLRYANGRSRLQWKLSYHSLSSRATVAYVLVPAKGKSGIVEVQLCRRCKADAHGTVAPIPVRSTKALLTRPGYVIIRTVKNPKGEIRGRISRIG